MKRTLALTLVAANLISGVAFSETVTQTLTEEEQLVVLQHRQAVKISPTSVKKGAEYANEFAIACKSFLTTFDEGTEITIERLNQFMGTSAGKFTIAMIGWKILGKDVFDILSGAGQTALGIILLIPYFIFLRVIYRNFVTGKKVCVQSEGAFWNNSKTYEYQKPVANSLESEPYVWWCMFSVILFITFTITVLNLIF